MGIDYVFIPCPDRYNYVVIEVNNRQLSCFINGIKIGEVQLNHSYKNSDKPLFLSNFNGESFFFGDIPEFRIQNGLLGQVEINQTQKKVQLRKKG
jgi:hypothetical protein